jgi:hypothetical protein
MENGQFQQNSLIKANHNLNRSTDMKRYDNDRKVVVEK